MSKQNYYNDRIKNLNKSQSELLRKSNIISTLRLSLVIIGAVVIYLILTKAILYVYFILTAILTSFLFVIWLHNKYSDTIEENDRLIKIFKNEIGSFSFSDNLFGNGIDFKNNKHPFSSDLDVFGKHSLFNLINRTVTFEGKNNLANRLLNLPSKPKKIKDIQNLLRELSSKIRFKEKFLSAFFFSSNQKKESKAVTDWIKEFRFHFINKITLKVILMILSLLAIATLVLGFQNTIYWKLFFVIIIVNLLIGFWQKKNVDYIHEYSSKQSELFLKYSYLYFTS